MLPPRLFVSVTVSSGTITYQADGAAGGRTLSARTLIANNISGLTAIPGLTNAGVATLDRGKRKAIYARIETLLAEQVPVIFLDWVPLLYVQPRNLKGFAPNALRISLFSLIFCRSSVSKRGELTRSTTRKPVRAALSP